MARIYNRDNINYSGLIGQAIQNANQTSQLYANKWQPGSTMGQALGQAGEKLQQAGWNEWSARQNDARAQAMQQRQFEQQEKMLKEQQEFQALESARARAQQILTNEQNAQNARELAKIQKETQAEYNRDEWMKQYELSGIDYDFAKAAYAKDPSEENMMRLRRAEANVLHWANKSGAPIYNPSKDLPSVGEVSDTAGYDISEAEKNLNKLKEGPWTDEKRDRALQIIADMPEENKAKKEEWTTTINNLGATKEQSKRDFDALQAEALATLKKNPNALPPTGYKWVWKGGKKVGIAKK